MYFSLQPVRDQSTAAFAWLLLAVALLCAPSLRLSADAPKFGGFGASAPQPAAAPAPAPAIDRWAAAPFVLQATSLAERRHAVNCLAAAVYYEAGTEPVAGQRAVAQVVLNRVRDGKFPPSVCGVVYQRAHRHHAACQFSFVCDGSFHRRPPGARQLAHARSIAEQALAGMVAPEVGTATFYHASYVHPSWVRRLVRVDRIGGHIFYRRPGEEPALSVLIERYPGWELGVGGLDRSLIRS